MKSPDQVDCSGKVIGPVAVLAFLAGLGGMAISFLFLASASPLDVLAGTAGFVAGAVLLAAGLLSVAVLHSPSAQGDQVARALRFLVVFAPPVVAAVCWPVLYFTLFLGGLLLMPLVLIGCATWAWSVSGQVARDFSAASGWTGGEPSALPSLSLRLA